MSKIRLATVWLDGCSGCHMSFLDLDERLLDLAEKIDLVFSPLVDRKDFPDEVDVTLVEGAVSSTEDLEKIKRVRAHTKILVSLGDCAVTANVPSMRNPFPVESVLKKAYVENATINQGTVFQIIPKLLAKSTPIHEIVTVDIFVPGCPPHRDIIHQLLCDLLEGRTPDLSHCRFGA
jgi:NAD-reducing hydrogenase small subunit